MTKLYTENIPGNLHESSNSINKRGLAEYVLTMAFGGGSSTVVVFKMPDKLVHALRAGDRSYTANPTWDDPTTLTVNIEDKYTR